MQGTFAKPDTAALDPELLFEYAFYVATLEKDGAAAKAHVPFSPGAEWQTVDVQSAQVCPSAAACAAVSARPGPAPASQQPISPAGPPAPQGSCAGSPAAQLPARNTCLLPQGSSTDSEAAAEDADIFYDALDFDQDALKQPSSPERSSQPDASSLPAQPAFAPDTSSAAQQVSLVCFHENGRHLHRCGAAFKGVHDTAQSAPATVVKGMPPALNAPFWCASRHTHTCIGAHIRGRQACACAGGACPP